MQQLIGSDNWGAAGVSRPKPGVAGRYERVAVDLLNEAECRPKLAEVGGVSRVFLAARRQSAGLSTIAVWLGYS